MPQAVSWPRGERLLSAYENFVSVQSEAALRNLASGYQYDAHIEGEMSLRSHTAEVAEHPVRVLAARVDDVQGCGHRGRLR